MQTETEKAIYSRTQRLLGGEMLETLGAVRVLVVGVGGVGSWCAEGLLRSGITHLTLVDSDRVCASNVNRQAMATVKTLGQVKVEALRARLLEINPDACIEAVQAVYSEENAGQFDLDAYDYVIDAIDSLKDKAALILRASASRATLFSSMGAACKVDPTLVKVAEFWEVRSAAPSGQPRKRLRKAGTLPEKKFLCVYDDQVLPNLGDPDPDAPRANGTLAPVTAIFGFTLAGLVIRDILRSKK